MLGDLRGMSGRSGKMAGRTSAGTKTVDHGPQMNDLTRRRIKQLRTARGWSQAELSRRTGIHSSTISHLEGGHMKLWQGHARRIAQALNVTLAELQGAV